MDHFYKNIRGWFTAIDLYKFMVNNCPNNSCFVEIGAFLGCSTAFMAVEIINSGKIIKFDVVDTWEGSPDLMNEEVIVKGILYDEFIRNMIPVRDFINPIRMTSEEASKLYENNSLEFVYIDGNHEYEAFSLDVRCWFPKVKYGGYIGGHDFNYNSVKRGVEEYFLNLNCEKLEFEEVSWLYKKL